MSEFGYRPSLAEIKAEQDKKIAGSQERRRLEKKKRSLKNRAVITAAGLAAATAIGLGAQEALDSSQALPNNRQTPERASKIDGSQVGTVGLTPEQIEEKAALDAAEHAREKAMVQDALSPSGIPDTVKNQNFEGLKTENLE